MSLAAGERFDPQAQADTIATAISIPLYRYDLDTVASIIESMANDVDAIRAAEIFDVTSEKVIFKAYRKNDNTFIPDEPIPQSHIRQLQQLVCPITHEQKKIAELHLFYSLPG